MAKLALDEIVVGEGRRALRETHVVELAASIAEVGLIEPIVVTAERALVAGLHRLAACRRLGWTHIDVRFVRLDALRTELIEIDENLVRSELTALERGEAMARRKEIYETLHPETRHGGAPGAKGSKTGGKAPTVAALPPTFVADTAAKTGRSVSAIAQDVRIANNLAPDVKDAIRATPIANETRKLIHLAKLPEKEQREAVQVMLAPSPPAKLEPAGAGDEAPAPEESMDPSVALVLGAFQARAEVVRALIRKAHVETKELRRNVPVANDATALTKISELVGLLGRASDLMTAMTPTGVCPKCRGRKPFCSDRRWRCGGWVSASPKNGGS